MAIQSKGGPSMADKAVQPMADGGQDPIGALLELAADGTIVLPAELVDPARACAVTADELRSHAPAIAGELERAVGALMDEMAAPVRAMVDGRGDPLVVDQAFGHLGRLARRLDAISAAAVALAALAPEWLADPAQVRESVRRSRRPDPIIPDDDSRGSGRPSPWPALACLMVPAVLVGAIFGLWWTLG
jgi:hypothetical protein